MAFRYFLLPTTQNVGSYWRKSNVHSALHIPRACSTHLKEKPWKETLYFPCSAKTIAKNSFILAEAIFQVKKKKKKKDQLNKRQQNVLSQMLASERYLSFPNTYFYLTVSLYKFVTFPNCCYRAYCHFSLQTVCWFCWDVLHMLNR